MGELNFNRGMDHPAAQGETDTRHQELGGRKSTPAGSGRRVGIKEITYPTGFRAWASSRIRRMFWGLKNSSLGTDPVRTPI